MLVCGLCACGALFLWAYWHEHRSEHANFERRAQFRASAVQQGMTGAIDALQVVNQLFITNGTVSREQFHSFTQPLRARHSFPYIEAFSYLRIVTHAERPAFEARMQARFPGFAIADMAGGKRVLAAAKERYSVIDYLEPMEGNDIVFGQDATPRLDGAMRRAADTGLPAATGLIPTIKGGGADRAVRVLMAVYRDGAPPPDLASRRRAVVGFTLAVLRTGELFEKILAATGLPGNADLDIRVYAAASADASKQVYGLAGAPMANHSHLLPRWWLAHRSGTFFHNFEIAGTAWHVAVSSRPRPFAEAHAGALFGLLMGLLATLAATAYLQSASMRTQRVEQLVAQRTDQLKRANDTLVGDMAARARAEEALRESRAELRALADHQERVKENERKRIARDIHDDLGQNLLALRLEVSSMAARPEPGGAAPQRFAALLEQIDTTIKAVRTIINDLRPSVLDLGLHAAVEWQARQFARRSGITCDVACDQDEYELDDERATALFRIVQESLTNIMRHARARRVQIGMQLKDGRFFMQIADDGIGLYPDCRRKGNTFGLIGIEERIFALGGTMSTASDPGQGMAIMLSIPV